MGIENYAWLSAELLDWYCTPGSGSGTGIEWNRSHEIWSHAEEILNKPATNLYLVDAITTLKRVVNQRISHLNLIYHFDQIPVKEKPKRLLEQLGFWGIIRPSMLKQLIDIRNAVEHEDAIPPSQERCIEFLDFVWYFLRSTDRLCNTMWEEAELRHYEISYIVGLEIDPDSNWEIKLQGSISHSMLSLTENSGWIQLELERLETVAEHLLRFPAQRLEYKDQQPDDPVFYGKVVGHEEHIREIIKLYFSILS